MGKMITGGRSSEAKSERRQKTEDIFFLGPFSVLVNINLLICLVVQAPLQEKRVSQDVSPC